MKELYEQPDMRVLQLEVKDVITESDPDDNTDNMLPEVGV